MVSPCLFSLRVSRLLKWGIFSGCALKVGITFIQNEVMVTRETVTQSFILKVKLYLLTQVVLLHLSCC